MWLVLVNGLLTNVLQAEAWKGHPQKKDMLGLVQWSQKVWHVDRAAADTLSLSNPAHNTASNQPAYTWVSPVKIGWAQPRAANSKACKLNKILLLYTAEIFVIVSYAALLWPWLPR